MAEAIGNVISALGTVVFEAGAQDNDTIDRLNHLAMYGLLILMAVATGSTQLVGTPIHCWVPAEYKEKFQKKYMNSHCWINSLYSIPFDESIPVPEEKRYFNDVMFYRWATVIFILLAFLFRVPLLLWREFRNVSGANVDRLVNMTLETALLDEKQKEKKLSDVAEFFHRWVTVKSCARRKARFPWSTLPCGKRSGHSLVILYILIKLLYLLNTIGQFFIISAILKTNFWVYGAEVARSYSELGEWEKEDVFPRVALCDMKVRQLQNLQTYTVQCVLSVNLFLEKMFLLLWFCLLLLLTANAYSFIRWVYRIISGAQRRHFLKNYFVSFPRKYFTTQEDMGKLLDDMTTYLQPDGLFVVRMVSVNTTDMLTCDLLKQIFVKYKEELEKNAHNSKSAEAKMN